MVINYMSAHDNNTLWDKLELSNGKDSEEERIKMNKLGAAILMVSKGTPFWQAGEEMLRTKDGDENSYKSSDAINNIDWSVLKEGSAQYETMQYYKGLIAMRLGFDVFTDVDAEVECVDHASGMMVVSFKGESGEALAIINPNATSIPYALDGEWGLVANGEVAGNSVIATESGTVTVDARSIRVYVKSAE